MLAQRIVQTIEWYATASAQEKLTDAGERANTLLLDLASDSDDADNKIESLLQAARKAISGKLEDTARDNAALRVCLQEWD